MGPAQAVRLTMNDYSRTHMVDKNGNVSITCQMAAGAMGGAMGGMFLNPTEVIKIRLQLEPTTTVSKLVRDTGIRGLCKGYHTYILCRVLLVLPRPPRGTPSYRLVFIWCILG